MVECHGRLGCPREGYSLNLSAEGLGMEDLRRRLAQVYEVCVSALDSERLAADIECLTLPALSLMIMDYIGQLV
jgi:hypothetical protein